MAQDDDFSKLPQAEFDGVVFPVISVRLAHGSAMAMHKFPHRPGQIIEPTGRDPIAGQMVAPMFSSLDDGNGRTAHWPSGIQLLREKAQQQKPGRCVIPPFGTLERAYIKIDESYDAAHRDGAYVTISFVEDTTDLVAKGTAPSAASKIPSLAFDLDTHLAALALALSQRLEDGLGNGFPDFATACGALLAMKDQAEASINNRIEMASRMVGALDDVLRAAKDTLSDPVAWETRDLVLNLKDAVTTLADDSGVVAAKLKTFTAAAAMSAADVASATANSVQEIIDLNSLPDPGDIAAGEVLVVYERG